MNSSANVILLAASLALLQVAAPAGAADDAKQAREIRALISATYDKPEHKVRTDPVVIAKEHAVASWIQGVRGGRALLRREEGKWVVVLCAGALLRDADGMQQAGVPRQQAEELSHRLAKAESTLPAARRRQFDLFGTGEDSLGGHHGEHADRSSHRQAVDVGVSPRKGEPH